MLGGGCGVAAAYYWWHLDQNAITGKLQFVLFTDADMKQLGVEAYEVMLGEYKDKLAHYGDAELVCGKMSEEEAKTKGGLLAREMRIVLCFALARNHHTRLGLRFTHKHVVIFACR